MIVQGPVAYIINMTAILAMLVTGGCAMVGVPDARNVDIPSPTAADSRKSAINERADSVMYLPLGEDILVPEVMDDDPFPTEMVGPFELRGETLAGALQLILADYDISIAFETEEGLTRRITVANLRGDLGKVVHQVCSLANLYCSYEDGTIVVKDMQTFTVTLPPLGTADGGTEYLDDVADGLAAILGEGSAAPIVDATTRTLVYSATQRTANVATRYFQRLRANTAMIVFETYIWEVSLNAGNSIGIDWFKLAQFGKFNTGIQVDGSVGADFTSPISIGLPTASSDFDGETGDLVEFLSQFGAVKTISQPQITVLSGSEAELRVADTRNYVSQIATTLDEGQSTTSVNTDSVDTGFTLTINSSWDKSTVYANVAIELTDVQRIDNFAFSDQGEEGGSTTIQLPQTSERQLTTQIRVRPGDSVLIAGLVRENDSYDDEGLGIMKPILPQSRTAVTNNLELVILLRPRVVVYTAPNDPRYLDFAAKKHKLPGTGVEVTSPDQLGEPSVQSKVPNEGDTYDEPAVRGLIPERRSEAETIDTNAPYKPSFVPATVQPVSKTTLSAPPVDPVTTAAPGQPVPLTPAPSSSQPAPLPATPAAPLNNMQLVPTASPSAMPLPPRKPAGTGSSPDNALSQPVAAPKSAISESNSAVPVFMPPAPSSDVLTPPATVKGNSAGNVYETYGDYSPER